MLFVNRSVAILQSFITALEKVTDFSRMLEANTPQEAEKVYNEIQRGQLATNAINYLINVGADLVAFSVNDANNNGMLCGWVYPVEQVAEKIALYGIGENFPCLCEHLGAVAMTQSHRFFDFRRTFGKPLHVVPLDINKYRQLPKHGGQQARGFEVVLTEKLSAMGIDAIHTGDDVMQSDIKVIQFCGVAMIECKGEYGRFANPIKKTQE